MLLTKTKTHPTAQQQNHNAPPINVLYIAGLGRSGSTVLNRVLGEIDGFFPAGEILHFFTRGINNNELCTCGEPVSDCEIWGKVISQLGDRIYRLVPLIDPFRDGRQIGKYIFNVCSVFIPWRPKWFAKKLRIYRYFVSHIYHSLQSLTDCRVIVDSSKNAAYAQILADIPNVRLHVIHLIRDSRGVAFSLTKKRRRPGIPWREEYMDQFKPFMGSLLWSAANLLAEKLKKKAVHYTRIRYHDFVVNPHEVLQKILYQMEIPFRPEDLSHLTEHTVQLKKRHIISGNPSRSQNGQIKLTEDVEWKTKLSKRNKIVVTALTFPFLYRYGFFSKSGQNESCAADSISPNGKRE